MSTQRDAVWLDGTVIVTPHGEPDQLASSILTFTNDPEYLGPDDDEARNRESDQLLRVDFTLAHGRAVWWCSPQYPRHLVWRGLGLAMPSPYDSGEVSGT